MHNNNINAVHTIKVSEETKKEIFNHVEDSYKKDVNEMILGKTCWRRTGITFETLSKILVAIGGVLSFSSGYFDSKVLSFISGSISVVSLALLQFSSFGFKQAKKRANDLNILLKKLDLDTIPVIDGDLEGLINGNNKTIDNKDNLNNDIYTMHTISDNIETKNEELKTPSSYSKNTEKTTSIKNIKIIENSTIPQIINDNNNV